ncbi:unnamed protein product [Spirodela intermedia]|uniref:Uncharacterized protein n=2 Tax=Spirodela intermedia TaxID=51605 RepID=A0A7I8J727_SPIIN|nr:unnamed protein product [Spirodela intermedia]CAA6665830.1 unnamed protein product [Spirodela intermedia]CAA6674483.1 unnamed protein product [Spirodela intermedia]CAB1184538.1 unnamed protein product [Spirodela intermedia]
MACLASLRTARGSKGQPLSAKYFNQPLNYLNLYKLMRQR